MAYWVCITDEDNWEVIKSKNIWGVPKKRKNIIFRVKKGDKIVIYLKQDKINDKIIEPRIVGIYEVISEPFEESTRIFKTPKYIANEIYPLRIKIKPIKIFKTPINFKSLIPKLEFIKDKRNWKFYLRTCMREISKNDFEIIVKYSEGYNERGNSNKTV